MAGCHLFDHHVTFKTIGDRLCVIISKFKRQTFRSCEAIQHTKCTLRFYRVEYSVIQEIKNDNHNEEKKTHFKETEAYNNNNNNNNKKEEGNPHKIR